jgi:hypothetical protein
MVLSVNVVVNIRGGGLRKFLSSAQKNKARVWLDVLRSGFR